MVQWNYIIISIQEEYLKLYNCTIMYIKNS